MASERAKNDLLPLLLKANALTFGTYTLKSGRVSPYFFNSSLLYTSSLLAAVSRAYASVLTSPPFTSEDGNPTYDILFGPAYKGIPLSALVTRELDGAGSSFENVAYAYNRKEAKAHGEGGSTVGAPLKDKRVVIIDDVMTAGTALREAVGIIQQAGGTIVGVALLLNRQERVSEGEQRSALKIAEDELNVPVRAVLSLEDIMRAVGEGRVQGAGDEKLKLMREYRGRYGSVD